MATDVVEKVVILYSRSGWKSIFAKFRFWYAPLIEVEQLLPLKGGIIDLGCGEGIFANYVGLMSKERNVVGIEIDEKRLFLADHGVKNVSFESNDITKMNIPKSDAIVLIQVLHHLHSFKEQENVIKRAVESLKRGGKLIIVEINVEPSVRYFLTWLTDHLLVAWFFEKRIYTPILFRKSYQWIQIFKNYGLSCNTIFPRERLKVFSNIIFECQKI